MIWSPWRPEGWWEGGGEPEAFPWEPSLWCVIAEDAWAAHVALQELRAIGVDRSRIRVVAPDVETSLPARIPAGSRERGGTNGGPSGGPAGPHQVLVGEAAVPGHERPPALPHPGNDRIVARLPPVPYFAVLPRNQQQGATGTVNAEGR